MAILLYLLLFFKLMHPPALHRSAFFFGFAFAKKNIMIKMKAIHQNSLKIKYHSLSHSDVSVKQCLSDISGNHWLEPSLE